MARKTRKIKKLRKIATEKDNLSSSLSSSVVVSSSSSPVSLLASPSSEDLFTQTSKNDLGSLDRPATEDHWPDYDPRSKQQNAKSRLLGASYDSKTYPNQFTYRNASGVNFKQEGGTCYFATACNFCKTIVWACTSKKLAISPQEIYRIAAQHGQTGGGYHDNCVWLLEYTGSNECIKEFQTICKACGVTTSNLNAGNLTCTKQNAIIALNEYGPFYWGHHCCFYSYHEYGQDSHAILGIGYDNDRFYWKGSWTSNETNSQEGFGSCTWSQFEEYGKMIGLYHWNLIKNV